MNKKILLSGVKPTGRPHIGNFFGAMKQFVDLQNDHTCYVMIADYHALNFIQNKEEMSENILGVILDYLAIGLDPKKVTIFKQSDVSAHTELAWIFDTITTMPYLMRAHAFKDAEAKNKEISVGTFSYPMLMAADILLYDADVVPVGQDQKQHVEIARDTAEKFNRIFGDTFKLPEPLILKDVAVVPGTDGQKMSKSYGNTIPLFASDEEIKKAVMSIETDSIKDEMTTVMKHLDTVPSAPPGFVTSTTVHRPANVYLIHKLIYKHSEAELQKLYIGKSGKYKELKETLIADLIAFIAPLREKREQLAKDPENVLKILKAGGEKAKAITEEKMKLVREKIGVKLY